MADAVVTNTFAAVNGQKIALVPSTSAYASAPSSPTSGDIWMPSDSYYVQRYSGSAWAPWGPIFQMTQPVSGDFSWVNQGTATVDTTNGGIFVEDATAGSLAIRARKKSAPATPYTITTAWLPRLLSHAATHYTGIGIGWRQSSDGKIVVFSMRNNGGALNVTIDKFSDASTFSASYANQNVHAIGPVVWLRITDNGTNRLCEWSLDGQHWVTMHTVGRTDYMTGDEVFHGLYLNTAAGAGTLISWKQT